MCPRACLFLLCLTSRSWSRAPPPALAFTLPGTRPPFTPLYTDFSQLPQLVFVDAPPTHSFKNDCSNFPTFHLGLMCKITRFPHWFVCSAPCLVCRALAFSGAHVVFAVRNTEAAKDLISQWQATVPAGKPPLRCEVTFHSDSTHKHRFHIKYTHNVKSAHDYEFELYIS